MASEMINKVLSAEKIATEKELEAKTKAGIIIKNAQSEAQDTIDMEKQTALKEKEQILAQAQNKAESIYSQAEANALEKSKLLQKQCEEKLEEAIEEIIKYIIPQ